MSDESWNSEIKTGLFVIAATVATISVSLYIAGSSVFGRGRVGYEVLMKESGGVRRGDRVRVAGVVSGRIERLILRSGAEWPVVFQVALDPAVRVTTASTAHIDSDGLLGAYYLEIDPGPATAPLLPEDGRIFGQEVASFETALARVDEISDRALVLMDRSIALLDGMSAGLEPVLGRAERLLSDHNLEAMSAIMTGLRTTAEEAGPQLSSLLAKLESVAEGFEKGTADIPELTARTSAVLESLEKALGPEGSRLAGVLDSADGALSVVDGNRAELEAMIRDMRDTATNLKALSQTLKQRPSSLVGLRLPRDRKPGQKP